MKLGILGRTPPPEGVVYLELIPNAMKNSVTLRVAKVDDEKLGGGNLMEFLPNGTFKRISFINRDIKGLSLDASGKMKENET